MTNDLKFAVSGAKGNKRKGSKGCKLGLELSCLSIRVGEKKNSGNCLTELPISVQLQRRDHKLEGNSAQLRDVNIGSFRKHNSKKIMCQVLISD